MVVELDFTLCGTRYSGTVEVDEEGKVLEESLEGLTNGYSLKKAYNDNIYYEGNYTGMRYRGAVEREVYKATHENCTFERCELSGILANEDELYYTERHGCVLESLTAWSELEDESVYVEDGSSERIRMHNGSIREYFTSYDWQRDRYYCQSCECYIEVSEDYYCEDTCVYCHEEDEDNVIEGYCESHGHTPILFGDYKDRASFVGLGFELEVDSNDEDIREINEDTARGLCSASGLEDDEMRYAYDGSLNYGFECISQPHTVKAFWDAQDKWIRMLKYLASKGYTSHDAGTCGLHVHVSRTMFGKTRDAQDTAIAKVYTFFDENWDDIVKVSRRRSFSYCSKNMLLYEDYEQIDAGEATKYVKWKDVAKKRRGSHDFALNNRNTDTFEYRLGRGTLNSWSFFSWIDFVLTLTKNAKRITVNKVESNDLVSWLGGITESTARYMYKRGAFKSTVLSLYPCIEWSGDYTDNGNE